LKSASARAGLPTPKSVEENRSRALREGVAYLIASRQADRALRAGSPAPSFRLADQDGAPVSSEFLLSRGPIVLMFYSGTWSPACNHGLVALDRLRPAIKARGGEVFAISQQTAAENRRARNLAGVEVLILGDFGGEVSLKFGVRWVIPELLQSLYKAGGVDLPALNGEVSWTLPIPARFVVDGNGVIVYSEVNPDQTRPSDIQGILPVVDHLLRHRLG
jgi:peroxiredoxin